MASEDTTASADDPEGGSATSDTTSAGNTTRATDSTSSEDGGSTSAADDTSAEDDGATSASEDTSAGEGGALECPPMELTCDLPEPLAHCDMSPFGSCIEYFHECVVGPEVEAGCEQLGTWGPGACPTTEALGTCIHPSLVQSVLVGYLTPGMTPEEIQQGCEDDGGTWCPSP